MAKRVMFSVWTQVEEGAPLSESRGARLRTCWCAIASARGLEECVVVEADGSIRSSDGKVDPDMIFPATQVKRIEFVVVDEFDPTWVMS